MHIAYHTCLFSDMFKVYYKGTYGMHSDDWVEVGTTTLNQYTLTGLVPGDRYQFEVVVLSEWTESEAETIEESICKCLHDKHKSN